MKTEREDGYQENHEMGVVPQMQSPRESVVVEMSPQDLIVNYAVDMVVRLFPGIKVANLDEIAEIYCEHINPIIADYFQMRAERTTMSEIVQNDPRLARLIFDIIDGKPLRVALLNAEISSIDPEMGDIDYDQYQDALMELERSRQAAQKHRKNCNRNGTCSRQEIKRFIDSQEMTAEQAEEFFDYVDLVIDSIGSSYIDGKMLKTIWKGLFFDREVERSRELAFIEGRNASIEQQRSSRRADNLPSASSAAPASKGVKMGYIERVMAGDY